MATIKEIADRLGVSSSTVSKGLNGGRDISEALRKQILETAVEMGYSSKRSQKSARLRLALFIENMDFQKAEDFGYEIVLGFRQAAYKENWQVEVIPITPEFQQAERYDLYMMQHGFCASYILGAALDDPWMQQIADTGYPTVLLDNYIPGNSKVGYLGTDSEEAMDTAITHLIRLGHEKIAFLNGSSHSYVSDERMHAYLQCMRRYHLPVNPNMAVYGYYVKEAAHYHVPALLDLGSTAILCGNDAIAAGVIESVRKAGLSVPEDVSVIGFDDMPSAASLAPPLTTIRQDRQALGKSGAYMIAAMLDGCSISRTRLRPQLIERSSTAPAVPRLGSALVDEKDSVLYVNPQLYAQYA